MPPLACIFNADVHYTRDFMVLILHWHFNSEFMVAPIYLHAFSALTLLVGRKEGHPTCKKLSGGVLEWLSVWGEVQIAHDPADATATHCLLLQ